MRVRVDLLGELRNRMPRGQDHLDVEIEDELTVGELVDRLGIRKEFYGGIINGKMVSETEALRDGATIAFFTPMHGG